MAVIDGWPAAPSVADQIELRKNLAGLILRDTSGNARAGIFPRHANPLVTATATMNVAIAAFEGCIVRGGGPVFVSNDGSVNVLLAAAPASNSRIDVVYVRQRENGYGGFADGSNLTELNVAQGTAAASPTVPSIPAGALALATVQVPSTATATNSSGVVITQAFPYTTTTGGLAAVRTTAEIPTLPTYLTGQRVLALDTGIVHKSNGTTFKPWESDWISYTATLTNFAVGTLPSGTPVATTLYKYVAGRVKVSYTFIFGSNGTAPNQPRFSLPVASVAGKHPFQVIGFGDLFDQNPGPVYFSTAVLATTTVAQIEYGGGTLTDPSTTTPFTWASGDAMVGELEYDPA